MNREIMFNVPLAPIGKPRMTQRDRWKKRPIVLRYQAWKDEFRKHVPEIDFEPNRLIVVAKMPMPKSWSNKKKASMTGKLHDAKPDADNILKAIGDTLLTDDKTLGAVAIVTRWFRYGYMTIILKREE